MQASIRSHTQALPCSLTHFVNSVSSCNSSRTTTCLINMTHQLLLCNTIVSLIKEEIYCKVYEVAEFAAGVCLPFPSPGFHFKCLFPLLFYTLPNGMEKWKRDKSALRKKYESLQRSEHLVLQDSVHVFCLQLCVAK